MQLSRIYPITDRLLSGLSHSEQVRRLIAGGARTIQIREKHLPAGDWFEDAKAAVKIGRDAGALMIINDRVDVAMAANANGVHLGQEDIDPVAARKLVGPGMVIGISTHSLSQVAAAAKLPVDYIAFGPVFSTDTKIDADAVVGIESLAAARKASAATIPLVAIGGINPRNINDVLAFADSAALISEIVRVPDAITQRVGQLNAITSTRR